MDVIIFSILLAVAIAFIALAYYNNSYADLMIPGVLFLLLGLALFTGDVTKSQAVPITANNTTIVQQATVTLDMPYQKIVALFFMFLSGLFFINAVHDRY